MNRLHTIAKRCEILGKQSEKLLKRGCVRKPPVDFRDLYLANKDQLDAQYQKVAPGAQRCELYNMNKRPE